jgi:hypothetical protein
MPHGKKDDYKKGGKKKTLPQAPSDEKPKKKGPKKKGVPPHELRLLFDRLREISKERVKPTRRKDQGDQGYQGKNRPRPSGGKIKR